MAIGDTESKVKIKVEAEMDDAIAEFERLAKAQAKAANEAEKLQKQAKLVGGKFEELGKSMVGLQLHDTFTRLSKAASDFTGGLVDLNGAFAGYQAAGLWGAAIGGLSPVIAKAYSGMSDLLNVTDQFTDGLKELNEESKKSGGNGGLGGLYSELKKVADEHQNFREALIGAFRQGVKSAKDYEDSIKSVLAVSKTLVSDIARINAAANGPDLLSQQISSIEAARKARENAAPGQFIGGFFGGVTGKQGKRMGGGGEESDAARAARLRGMLGGQSTDNGPSGAASPFNIFDSGQQGKASSNLDEFGRQRDELSNLNNELEKTAAWKAELTASRAKDQSFMESVFGKLGEVDLYKSAFDGLTGAVTAGYDAMVDGTMSFGAAFKKSIADALKALGGQMLVEALKETAYGIASLARYDYGAAGLHFKSAAGFGLGAAAAGVVASGLGGGGGGSSSGVGRAPSVGAPSSSGTAGTGGVGTPSGPTYIIQTNPWSADDTPRMKRNQVDKILASSSQARN